MSTKCETTECDRDAEVRVDFGSGVDTGPVPMCRYHAGFECRHHPLAETVPLGGEAE